MNQVLVSSAALGNLLEAVIRIREARKSGEISDSLLTSLIRAAAPLTAMREANQAALRRYLKEADFVADRAAKSGTPLSETRYPAIMKQIGGLEADLGF